MKVLFNYLRPHKKWVIFALILATINQVASLTDPIVYRMIIDKYAVKYKSFTEMEFMIGIFSWIGLALLTAMISRIAKNIQDYYVNVITQKIGAQIYQDGIKHTLSLPFQTFEDQRSGETLGQLQKVRTDTERLINAFVNILFGSLIGIIFVIIYSLTIYWPIAPVYFATMPIIFFLSSYLSRKIKIVQQKIVAQTTALAGSTTESLRNIELVKSLGLSNQEIKRLNENTDKILDLELQKVKYVRTLSFIQGTTINFLRNSIITLMLYFIFREKITLGQYFSLYMYSFFIFNPLQELGNIIQLYKECEVSLNNFEKLLSVPVEKIPENPQKIDQLQKLTFDQVSFQHQSASSPALQNISFEVKKGETVAFVGPSGSGKTTLVKLLVGLYRAQKGDIQYNETSGHLVDYNQIRQMLGFVTQEAQLFSGTIKDNLQFVKPDATDQELLDVLHKASCQNLLARAENGLDSKIGEGGIKISGGEKQRLSIARALLRNPSLLIFDEATSALDSLTEEEITNTLRDLSKENHQIIVLIAHRLSTIMHATRIYVLEKGQMVEMGTHDELLAQKGLYYAMWRQQIGERKK